MGLSEPEQTRLYHEHWQRIEEWFGGDRGALDSFARDYVALRIRVRKQPRSDGIYFAFKNAFETLKEEDGGVSDALESMTLASRRYAEFPFGRAADPEIGNLLGRARRLRASSWNCPDCTMPGACHAATSSPAWSSS